MFISSISSPIFPPKRIVSLVPSITELLHYIDLEEKTVGITKFCVHPQAWFKSKTRIGGTKNINIEKIISLQPDLILCNKEENVQAQIETLALTLPIYMCDIKNYEDALQTIKEIGILTCKESVSNNLINNINDAFEQIKTSTSFTKKIKTAYLIWKEPYMTVGGDTFISAMMEKAGLQNIYNADNRYPTKIISDMQDDNPQLILLSSEPYPFKEKHIVEMQQYFPNATILLADGEMFSWYGSRMLYAAKYFKNMIAQFQSV
jgi:ABC-type Fe3+-hydroxamate transport system substrate-binding protein